MKECLPQMIHIESRKKQENLPIPAENALSRPGAPNLQGVSTAPAGRILLTFLAQDAKIIPEQSHKFSNPYIKPFKSWNKKKTPEGGENLPRKEWG